MYSVKSLLIACLLFLASSAFSAVYYVDHQGNSGVVGDPWNNVYTSVDAVLSIATAGDIIHVSQGNYQASSGSYTIPNGVRIYGGYPSNGTVYYLYRTYLRNPNSYPTTLSGTNAIRVMNGQNNQTYLDGFHLQGTNAGVQFFNVSGSGFTVEPIFANCTISGGSTGVLSMHAGTIRPQFNNCKIINSQSGIVFIGMQAGQDISPKFLKCDINNNHTGIVFRVSTGNVTPEFDRCRIFDNTGYAISNDGLGIGNSYINACPDPAFFSYHPQFSNTLIYGNSGILNAAVAIGCPTKTDVSVYFNHCTMYDNAPTSGHPAFNLESANSLFTNTNTSYVFKMENSISWNNLFNGELIRLETAMRCRIKSSLIEPTNCISSGGSSNTAYILTNPHQWIHQVIDQGGNIFGQNPMFKNPTAAAPQLDLLAGSPARNAGENTLTPMGINVDFRNYIRVNEGVTDMGAYEFCPKFYNCTPTVLPKKEFKPLDFESTLEIEAYPNPFENVVHVNKNGLSFTKVEVLNLEGKILIEKNFDEDIIDIHTAGLLPGAYLIRMCANEDYVIKKLIKK